MIITGQSGGDWVPRSSSAQRQDRQAALAVQRHPGEAERPGLQHVAEEEGVPGRRRDVEHAGDRSGARPRLHRRRQPDPYSGVNRGPGKELFTESIIALNVKTGKFAGTTRRRTTTSGTTTHEPAGPVRPEQGRRRSRTPARQAGCTSSTARTGSRSSASPRSKVPQARAQHVGRRSRSRTATPSRGSAPTEGAYAGKKAPPASPTKGRLHLHAYDDTGSVAFHPRRSAARTGRRRRTARNTGYMYICSNDSPFYLKSVPAAARGSRRTATSGSSRAGPGPGLRRPVEANSWR